MILFIKPSDVPVSVAVEHPITRTTVRQMIERFTGHDGATVPAFRIELDAATWLTGWCHDEGIILRLPLNFVRWNASGDPIHGPVVVTRESRDEDGRLLDVRPEDAARLRFSVALSGTYYGHRVLTPATDA